MDPLNLERKAVQPPGRCEVGPHRDAGGREPLGKLHDGIPALRGCVHEALKALAGRLLASPDGHVDLCGRQFLPLCPSFPEARRQGQAVFLLQGLRCFNGPPRFPLTKPDLAGQVDPAGDDVNVVVVCVLVPDHHVRRRAAEAHLAHEALRHLPPLPIGKALPRRRGQGRMPDGLGDVGPQLPNAGKLGGQLSRCAAVHRAPDDLRLLGALLQDVVQGTPETGPPANLRFHRPPPRSATWRRRGWP